jgi:hypothetical protein
VTCPVSNKRFIERGCRPEYKGKACCPTRFVCRKFSIYFNLCGTSWKTNNCDFFKNSWGEIGWRSLPVPWCLLPHWPRDFPTQPGRRMQNRLHLRGERASVSANISYLYSLDFHQHFALCYNHLFLIAVEVAPKSNAIRFIATCRSRLKRKAAFLSRHPAPAAHLTNAVSQKNNNQCDVCFAHYYLNVGVVY